MKTRRSIAGTVVLSSLFLGNVAAAEAATLTNSYFVRSALQDADRYSSTADHFANLGSIVGYGDNVRDYVESGNVFLDVYDDGTAHFHGIIKQREDARKQFKIDVRFNYRGQGQDGQGQDKDGNKTVKRGLSDSQDIPKWHFYDIDQNSKLIGLGDNAGLGTILIEDASGGKYPVQLGLGANDKNSNFGLSTWFRQQGTTSGHSDFNVELVARDVPEPTMGLVLAGLAGARVLRRQKKAASK